MSSTVNYIKYIIKQITLSMLNDIIYSRFMVERTGFISSFKHTYEKIKKPRLHQAFK